MGGRYCADCQEWCSSGDFSGNQWRKGDGSSRCMDCVGGNSRNEGRRCAECQEYRSIDDFSNNQWYKGEAISRCMDCVNRVCYCPECGQSFNNHNELKMHSQVHRPRNVACPVCGEQRFRSGANAVQHVESGSCSSCRGKDNARKQIYRFASNQRKMQRFLTNTPLLTNGSNDDYHVPEYPYRCPECSKPFRQLSQLLQHQDNKHRRNHMLTNY